MQKSSFLLLLSLVALNATQIKSINFEGLKQISPSTAANMTGLKIGDTITGDNTNQAIINLFEQGFFDDAYIEENGGNLTFHVQEKPIIAKIDVEGVVTNDKKAINEIIGLKKGQTYDKVAIARVKERIKQYYQVKGYFDTVVEVDAKPINKDSSALHLTAIVNRGENIIIEKINLVGAKKLGYSNFEDKIVNKEREMLGWMWGFYDGGLKISELSNDSIRIKDEYLRKGYLDAYVSEPYLNVDRTNYRGDLTYYIQEGERYRVGQISIDAPSELGLNTAKIIRGFALESGDRFNIVRARKDVATLENLVADKGYAFVKVVPDIKQDKEKLTADIVYKIYPENKIKIRNVSISGNEKTADRVIRREMYLTEGNYFSATDLIDSQNALKRTGYFDEVEIEKIRVNDNELDLVVKVKEAPTGEITGGIGYGSSDGLLLNAGISDKNVFGSGMKGEFNIEKSDDSLSGAIGLTNPRIFDSQYMLGGKIYANDYDWNDYKEKSYGLSLTTGRMVGRYTNVGITYNLENSKIEGLNDFYKAAGYLNGKNVKSSITPFINFNNTDDYFIPRSGAIAGAAYEYAGVGGDIKYSRLSGNLNWYYGLRDYVDYDLIFRYKANAGVIFGADDTKLPVNYKQFLGGIRSIRGYESRSIPKQKICIDRSCRYIETGGKKSFNNSFELSFPLIDRLKMRLVTFYDYGMIGNDSFNEEKRSSTGAGIEWMTPIGPMQLFWTKPLRKKEYDETESFQFTIGSKF